MIRSTDSSAPGSEMDPIAGGVPRQVYVGWLRAGGLVLTAR